MSTPSEKKKKNTRLALIVLLVIVLLLVFVAWKITSRADHITQVKAHTKISGTILKKPLPMPDFSLQATGGKHYTNVNLAGHWTLLFFGFSNCPYVCPTTLAQLNAMLQQLKQAGVSQASLPQVVMVSVDPARDTAARMHAYVTSFNPGFIGLRTSEAQTLQLAKQMRVSFAKIQAPGADSKRYTITHTATITVIGPQGRIRAYLSYPHKAAVMARDYQTILRSAG